MQAALYQIFTPLNQHDDFEPLKHDGAAVIVILVMLGTVRVFHTISLCAEIHPRLTSVNFRYKCILMVRVALGARCFRRIGFLEIVDS